MYSSCPCCGEMDNWHFQSGVIDGEPIEPSEWACETCGFEYREHVKHPMGEAALKFAPVAVENVRREEEVRIRRETIEEIVETWIMPHQQNDSTIYIIDGDAFINEVRALAEAVPS